jgi:hypothetical protein
MDATTTLSTTRTPSHRVQNAVDVVTKPETREGTYDSELLPMF